MFLEELDEFIMNYNQSLRNAGREKATEVRRNRLSKGLKAGVAWYPYTKGSVGYTVVPILEKGKLRYRLICPRTYIIP